MADDLPVATSASGTPAVTPPASPPPDPKSGEGEKGKSFLKQRLLSLDVYRGLIMITLAFNGFGLARTATLHLQKDSGSEFWREVHHQFEHVEWVGCGYWDLIQPSFMFMVGAAMAFSYRKRQEMGHGFWRMLAHAIGRSFILIFLGIFLISNWGSSTSWSLMNVLTQIGLGYTFLFLLWNRPFAVQAIAAVVILVGTWLAYFLYPGAGIDLETGLRAANGAKVGISPEWAQKYLTGIPPAWHKNANIGHEVDLWLLNQLPVDGPYAYYEGPLAPVANFFVRILNTIPHGKPFEFNRGGYQTFNFIPSLATMLFGLMAGELLRSGRSHGRKLLLLLLPGLAGLALGWALDAAGICPLVKRIWTPSWALFSTGWCCLILAGLYLLADINPLTFWTFPFVVVGVNSIAMYVMGQLLDPWARRTWEIHLGPDVFTLWGHVSRDFAPTVQAIMVGMLYWLICLYMYRKRIFIRI